MNMDGAPKLMYNDTAPLKATRGVWGQKKMLILFERFHRCGVNAFY